MSSAGSVSNLLVLIGHGGSLGATYRGEQMVPVQNGSDQIAEDFCKKIQGQVGVTYVK
jgi:hypothetical protein